VSNTICSVGVSRFIVILFGCSLWAQHPYSKEAENAAIKRVKKVDVSSLESGLPKVTLEFFLKYESEGAPIGWRGSDCELLKGKPFVDRELLCVEADIDLKGDRSATIVVSVGTFKKGSVGVPRLCGVTVTDANGRTHAVRLSDLPMEFHRPLPKSPGDLPLPAGAAFSPLAAGTHPNS
jgi:hypothetical protein